MGSDGRARETDRIHEGVGPEVCVGTTNFIGSKAIRIKTNTRNELVVTARPAR